MVFGREGSSRHIKNSLLTNTHHRVAPNVTLPSDIMTQVNQEFQIDIHPGAEFGAGVFIDHGTGIVVGETAVVGDDVSMLHRVTLGGSGVQCSDRHPKVKNLPQKDTVGEACLAFTVVADVRNCSIP